jgi:hypothetical protein
MSMREKIARIVLRKTLGFEYTGDDLFSDPHPRICNAVGTADAILNILNEYGEEEIEAALRAFIWRGAEVLEQDEAEVEQQFADMDAQGKLAVREGLRAAIRSFLGTLS